MKIFILKRRDNPQLGTYYIAYKNPVSKSWLKDREKSTASYGSNYYIEFESLEELELEVKRLEQESGKKITWDSKVYE